MPVSRKSKFTEHIDDAHPFEIERPRSLEAYRPISADPNNRSWSPLIPLQRPRPSPSVPSTKTSNLEHCHKSSSIAASTLSADPATLVDVHPLFHSPQERATFFIFHSASHICDTGLLFESHPVSPFLLTLVLHVLNGEGATEDLKAIERYRCNLPIYRAYCSLDPDFNWTDGSNDEDLDAWLSSQQAWESCENVVLEREWDAYMGEKTYAEILRGLYHSCDDRPSGGFADFGTDVGGSGGVVSEGLEEDRFEYEERHISDDDMAFDLGEIRGQREDLDGEEREEHRGRSRTRRRATAARRRFKEGEVW